MNIFEELFDHLGDEVMEDKNKVEATVNEEEEQIEELEEQVAEQEAELAEERDENTELKDKYIRLLAEFENFKKRSIRERIQLMDTAAEDTLLSILPVLDDFDRAKKVAEMENSTEQFSDGVALVYNKLYANLAQKGLKPMESTGEIFDPELHEAITEIPAPSPEMKGRVVDTVETGYYLNDKIIRFAKVVVGK